MNEIYKTSMLVIGTEGLIMGITVLLLRFTRKTRQTENKLALIFLSIAMLVLGFVNLAEYYAGTDLDNLKASLAVVSFAASIELFLLQFTYMSILNPQFVTKKRIFAELGLIITFTLPAICAIPFGQTELFDILFTIGIVFYVVKLGINLHIYKKNLRIFATYAADNHSDSRTNEIQWISNTFYVVISVGIISVVVPLTSFEVLVLYNWFLFFAYLYIYLSILRHIYIMDDTTELIPDYTALNQHMDQGMPAQRLTDNADSLPENFMNEHHTIFQHLASKRFYATPGITADKVASLMNTNRTMLSTYLNKELNMSYYEWIARLRIEDAKRQLIDNPNIPVVEIAFNVGIEDKSNFGRTFKRIVGQSPQEYRNQHIQSKTHH